MSERELEETPEVEQEPTEEREAPEPQEFDYEAEARKEGWVSEEEWVEAGKPADSWKPAKDFYEAGQTILPIVQAKLRREQEERRKEREAFERRLNKLESQNKATLDMQREAWEKELKKQRATAIRDGDGDKVNEIDDRISQLRQVTPEPQGIDPAVEGAVEEFKSNNSWYGTDEDMTVYADAAAAKIRAENPNMTPKELLTRVTARTKSAFSHKFQTKRTPTVESGTRSSSKSTKKKDYESLPSDAKKECTIFLDSIPDGQRDEFRKRFIENYYANNEE